MEISLLGRHTIIVGYGAFSHYVTIFKEIINLGGNLNRITGSRVTAILLNGWIMPIGGASEVEGLLSTGPTLFRFLPDFKSLHRKKKIYIYILPKIYVCPYLSYATMVTY